MNLMQNKELQMFISAVFAGLLYYLGIVAVPIIMLVFAMIIDWLISQGLQQINVDLHYSVFFAVLVAVWLIINELISVLENLAKMGVPIPNFLKKLIDRLKNTVDEKGDDKSDR